MEIIFRDKDDVKKFHKMCAGYKGCAYCILEEYCKHHSAMKSIVNKEIYDDIHSKNWIEYEEDE